MKRRQLIRHPQEHDVATEQVGLPRSDFGKAVRYMLERWAGLSRFIAGPAARSITMSRNGRARAVKTAKLIEVHPHAYLLRALSTAIARPGAVTRPEDLLCARSNR